MEAETKLERPWRSSTPNPHFSDEEIKGTELLKATFLLVAE